MRIAGWFTLDMAPDPTGVDILPAVPGDPMLVARLIHDLVDKGWTREHILALNGLKLSQATFYRRMETLRQHNPKLHCPTLASRRLEWQANQGPATGD